MSRFGWPFQSSGQTRSNFGRKPVKDKPVVILAVCLRIITDACSRWPLASKNNSTESTHSWYYDRLIEDGDDGCRVSVALMPSETRRSDTVIPLDECPGLAHSGESDTASFTWTWLRPRLSNANILSSFLNATQFVLLQPPQCTVKAEKACTYTGAFYEL